MGKVSVFSDDVEEIAHEVKQFFDEDLVLNDELVELISNSYQHEINSPHLKMARVPSSVRLAFGKDPSGKPSCFPLISANNVTVCFSWSAAEKSFSLLEEILLISNREKRFLLRNIYLSVEETDIVSILETMSGCSSFRM